MIKPIAIYLPQFHPIPENDKAWGDGFTEWTNVKKAKPLFEGHYQPHIPHEDVGYYDLRNPEVMVRQAAMAEEFGIYGFAFYHYWFNGKRLLETPLDNMLKTGKPDFPFLYIWANEHWSRRWDGSDHEIIQEQHYSHEDDLNHIQFLCKNVFSDKRYITIDEKPVFMVYRTELLPDIKETARIWREEAKRLGFKGLYLVRVENFDAGINPLDIGFDAAMEFAPDSRSVNFEKSQAISNTTNYTHDYESTVVNTCLKSKRSYPWFRCASPGWDNSSRKQNNATVFVNNTPQLFNYFLQHIINDTLDNELLSNKFVFINAWNEWAEGCHLEPDNKNGYAFLETVKRLTQGDQLNNIKDYSNFLTTLLNERSKEYEVLHNIKKEYDRMTRSNGHRIMESVLKKYRKVKKLLNRPNA